MMMRFVLVGAVLLCAVPATAQNRDVATAVTPDGVTIYGQRYFGDLPSSAPLILQFHQGGSNGRGEYGELAPWLNENGFRVIAWDQRSGGDTYGSENRTVQGLGESAEFCSAYGDLQAAIGYVITEGLADRVIVWGSSYSGSLVFRLAADVAGAVSGVIAFSPASGGPMTDCRARMWVDDVAAPIMVLRPASEMEREPSVEQRQILVDAGAEFHVIEGGVHGSSMLVDSRTGADMSEARALVLEWLRGIGGR